jgi:hypothetical protein
MEELPELPELPELDDELLDEQLASVTVIAPTATPVTISRRRFSFFISLLTDDQRLDD